MTCAAPFIGVEHSVHKVPHELGLISGWQTPMQSWLPPGQMPMHEALLAMQAPAHSFIPGGQSPPHVVPSQVAVPPVGTGHAVQLEPQEPSEVLLAHAEPQA